MGNWGNNYNNGNRYNNGGDPTAFLVQKESKKGTAYWSGVCDMGGKLVRVTMFENTKDGAKSDFIVKLSKVQQRRY